jgi:chromosome segregation protein
MKLRKLIVSGFKSFADRTEFEFDDGISCIVGPNGCGKSNVVDAMKWVLGEQSAKSLRGSEMMDVIFNGSSGRRPSGSAEVTLLFDNSGEMRLNIPGEENASTGMISVTRRLYRSGASEYLINKAPARLKDIREMFMDTGIGNDAYGVIEQGRVEGFLQANPDDRRAIFDEAAGISKYKARRKEALRKLERVQQNLLRVNDVLAEVDKRLRSIKYQAGKARNHQAYTQRLKELKALYLLFQYHTLTGQRSNLKTHLDAVNDSLASVSTMIGQLDSAASSTEAEAADLEHTARDLQGKIASVSAQIETGQQRAEMLLAKVKDLGEQILRTSSRCEELEAKIETCDQEIATKNEQLGKLDSEIKAHSANHDAARAQYNAGEMAVVELQGQLEDEKAGTIDLLRRTSALHNEISGLSIRQENLTGQKNRLTGRADQIEQSLAGFITQQTGAKAKLGDAAALLTDAQGRLEQAKQAGHNAHDSEQRLLGDLSAAREKRSALVSREQTLREMHNRLEGIGAGVRKVLQATAQGGLKGIRGMLGDLIDSDLEHAKLVEAALAGADQLLLVANVADLSAIADELKATIGESAMVELQSLERLEILRCDLDTSGMGVPPMGSCGTGVSPVSSSVGSNHGQSEETHGQDAHATETHGQDAHATLRRVIDYVRVQKEAAPLVWRLLGKTLIVDDLPAAAALAAAMPRGYRFVTAQGQVLEADGRIRFGAANRGAGVITRRSELAQLQSQLAELSTHIDTLSQQCQVAKAERMHLDDLQQKLRTAIYEANTERVECENRLSQLDNQIAALQREKPVVAQDITHLAAQMEQSLQAQEQAKAKAAQLEELNAQRQQAVERLTEELAAARSRQATLNNQITEIKVALAGAEQRRYSLKEATAALARQREQMDKDYAAGKTQIELDRQRRQDSQTGAETAKAEVERLYAQKVTMEKEAADIEESQRSLRERLDQIRQQLSQHRAKAQEISTQLNTARVELGEVDVRIESLIARANDEMGVNLSEAYASYQHDPNRDWEGINAEIQELREKIERIGNVNYDAITEQEELEKRHEFLTTQMKDISNSQNQLDDLIRRINQESRERFLATFTTVRENFQELFRKLFGGGRADILLENPEDVLESPIEIVARPPGKETRTLTLLSGGEKTMTALAMLFSIFKSRPSPFCLLDEVDAALDEANNQRFNMLVAEFVSISQFVIISHSKRTMSAASVLYGVTMQEPGVSKRISVRFEEAGKYVDDQLQPA